MTRPEEKDAVVIKKAIERLVEELLKLDLEIPKENLEEYFEENIKDYKCDNVFYNARKFEKAFDIYISLELVTLLDKVGSIFSEEYDKIVKTWVKENKIKPKKEINNMVYFRFFFKPEEEFLGFIDGIDYEKGLYKIRHKGCCYTFRFEDIDKEK